tara:strand:+ start:2283 stop:2861 length:579 start_codon:yes stop_codon:yes gene_type:complete
MACLNFIDAGRALPCKDSVGGLKHVYFLANTGTNADTIIVIPADYSGDQIISYVGSTTANSFRYSLKGNSTFEQNITSSRESGTTYFEQVLTLTLSKLSVVDNKAVKLLAFGNPQVIVEDYNGNFFIAGLLNGMDVTGGTIVTGGAMGDMSGYTLTLTGMEKTPANFLKIDTVSDSALGFADGSEVINVDPS